jgi:hypothetical protein
MIMIAPRAPAEPVGPGIAIIGHTVIWDGEAEYIWA